MAKDEISILDGSTFVVSDSHGDVEAGPDRVQGLFYRDIVAERAAAAA